MSKQAKPQHCFSAEGGARDLALWMDGLLTANPGIEVTAFSVSNNLQLNKHPITGAITQEMTCVMFVVFRLDGPLQGVPDTDMDKAQKGPGPVDIKKITS